MALPLDLVTRVDAFLDHVGSIAAGLGAAWMLFRRVWKQMKRRVEARERAAKRTKAALAALTYHLRGMADCVRQLAREAGWHPDDPRKRKLDEMTDMLYEAEGNHGNRGGGFRPEVRGQDELQALLRDDGEED